MHQPEPLDYSPLSFGAGLAVGLLLILALPAESTPTTAPKTVTVVAHGWRE